MSSRMVPAARARLAAAVRHHGTDHPSVDAARMEMRYAVLADAITDEIGRDVPLEIRYRRRLARLLVPVV